MFNNTLNTWRRLHLTRYNIKFDIKTSRISFYPSGTTMANTQASLIKLTEYIKELPTDQIKYSISQDLWNHIKGDSLNIQLVKDEIVCITNKEKFHLGKIPVAEKFYEIATLGVEFKLNCLQFNFWKEGLILPRISFKTDIKPPEGLSKLMSERNIIEKKPNVSFGLESFKNINFNTFCDIMLSKMIGDAIYDMILETNRENTVCIQ